MNELLTKLFGKLDLPDKLILFRVGICHPLQTFSHLLLYMPLTCAEGYSVGICCAKQEHLIAMTKIKHFNQHKLFSRTWITSRSLQFLLRCGTWPLNQSGPSPRGVGLGHITLGLPTRNILLQEELGNVNEDGLSGIWAATAQICKAGGRIPRSYIGKEAPGNRTWSVCSFCSKPQLT